MIYSTNPRGKVLHTLRGILSKARTMVPKTLHMEVPTRRHRRDHLKVKPQVSQPDKRRRYAPKTSLERLFFAKLGKPRTCRLAYSRRGRCLHLSVKMQNRIELDGRP